MPTLNHPNLDGAEFEAVTEEQADALAASGWERKKTGQAPTKTTAPRKRAAKKKTPATPTATAAKTEEK